MIAQAGHLELESDLPRAILSSGAGGFCVEEKPPPPVVHFSL
jgi:hypothetical protein